jgi:hypothetical protein
MCNIDIIKKKNPSEIWKIVNSFKDRSQDPSYSIAPQDWYNYFKDLMNIEYNNNFVELDECKYLHCNNDLLNSDISAEEVIHAVKCLKGKKACGSDCISNEMIKISYNVLYAMYVDVFNVILKSGKYPSIWRENFIKSLFKGGCANDPSCYRGKAISSF